MHPNVIYILLDEVALELMNSLLAVVSDNVVFSFLKCLNFFGAY